MFPLGRSTSGARRVLKRFHDTACRQERSYAQLQELVAVAVAAIRLRSERVSVGPLQNVGTRM